MIWRITLKLSSLPRLVVELYLWKSGAPDHLRLLSSCAVVGLACPVVYRRLVYRFGDMGCWHDVLQKQGTTLGGVQRGGVCSGDAVAGRLVVHWLEVCFNYCLTLWLLTEFRQHILESMRIQFVAGLVVSP